MKLKYQLVVSFLIIVIIPIALVAFLVNAYPSLATELEVYFNLDRAVGDGGPNSVYDAVISVILILIFTAAILVIWIYRGMILKINRLIYGANNIKEGNLNFSIATDGTDELSELMNTFEDMKERLRMDSEEKIITENEQRELISNIAHDIKTPLTAIAGYAEGILDGVADTEEKKETYVRTISKKAEDLNNLLNDLMTYSNISTNRIPYNFTHMNVKQYFTNFFDELRVDFDAMYGTMEYEIDVLPETEFIVDIEQFRRVIENLVNNAVKYKRDVALEVKIRVKEADEAFVQFEMEDNGIGIKNEDIPYIFDRTYRADSSRQSGVGGSGLGLSIARKIIEDHGGKIWATSSVGRGTCFYILLRKYTLPGQKEERSEKNSDNRRRRSNSRVREGLSGNK